MSKTVIHYSGSKERLYNSLKDAFRNINLSGIRTATYNGLYYHMNRYGFIDWQNGPSRHRLEYIINKQINQ